MKKIIFYNVIIFCFAIFSLEILARILNLSPLVGVSKNLINDTEELRQNNSSVKATVFGKKVFTDKLGFRVPSIDFEHQGMGNSILLLGDSVSFGVGVDDTETFVGLMRKEKQFYNFYNTSVVGHNIKNYKQVINKYKDMENLKSLILFYCINDIHFDETTNLLKPKKKVDTDFKIISFLKNIDFILKINDLLRSKSVLYLWIKNISSDTSKRYFMYSYPAYKNPKSLILVKNNLKEIKNISESKNLNLKIVILPYEYQTRKENCNKKYLLPQKEIIDIANSLDIKFFDYSKNFCNYESSKNLFLKYDPVHLSEEGHKFVYDLIKNDIF